MPQLTMITSGSELSLNFRWPYQAKVMNTLEANNIRMGSIEGEIVGIESSWRPLESFPALTSGRGTRFRPISISFDFKTAKARHLLLKTAQQKPATIETIGQTKDLIVCRQTTDKD